ncbi:MAG: hypothetical protein Q4G68_01000 [Planctomycetia bacterium]|nr:hypothetical protein [Planctomycetia bacterium]
MLESLTLVVCLTTLAAFFVALCVHIARGRRIKQDSDLTSVLLEKERLFQLVVDNVPFPIYCKDMDDNFRYILCNKACIEQNQRSLSGLTDFDLYSAACASLLRANDSSMLAEQPGTSRVFEEKTETADGQQLESRSFKQFVVSGTGRKLLIGVSVDQTEQNQLRQKVEVNAGILHTVLDNIPAAIVAKDVNDGLRHVIWNKELERLTEIPADAVLGQNDAGYEYSTEIGTLLHGFDLQTLAEGEIRLERSFKTRSGKEVFMRVDKKLFNLPGGLTLIVDFGLDLTREKELQQRSSEIIDYQKDLVGKSQFINECLHYMTIETDVDKIINYLLGRFGSEESADRSFIWLFKDESLQVADCRYEWASHSVLGHQEAVEEIDMSRFPSALHQICAGNDIVIDDVQELACDDPLYEHLQKESVRSMIMVPFCCGGRLRGLVGLEYMRAQRIFSEGDVRTINNIAHMLELAYVHKIQFDAFFSFNESSTELGCFSKLDIPAGIFSSEGRLLLTNAAFEPFKEMFPGLKENSICTGSFCRHGHTPDWCPVHCAIAEKKIQRMQIVVGGRTFIVTALPVLDQNQNVTSVMAILNEITDLIMAQPLSTAEPGTANIIPQTSLPNGGPA